MLLSWCTQLDIIYDLSLKKFRSVFYVSFRSLDPRDFNTTHYYYYYYYYYYILTRYFTIYARLS
jgi:hypothetical protein